MYVDESQVEAFRLKASADHFVFNPSHFRISQFHIRFLNHVKLFIRSNHILGYYGWVNVLVRGKCLLGGNRLIPRKQVWVADF